MSYNYGGITAFIAKNWAFSPERLVQVDQSMDKEEPTGNRTDFRLGRMLDCSEMVVEEITGTYVFRLVRDRKAVTKQTLAPMEEKLQDLIYGEGIVDLHELWDRVRISPDTPFPETLDGLVATRDNIPNIARFMLLEEQRTSRLAGIMVVVEELPHNSGHLIMMMTGNPNLAEPLREALFGAGGLVYPTLEELDTMGAPSLYHYNPIKYDEGLDLKILANEILMRVNDEEPVVSARFDNTSWRNVATSPAGQLTLNTEGLVDSLYGSLKERDWVCTRLRMGLDNPRSIYRTKVTLDWATGVSKINIAGRAIGDAPEDHQDTPLAVTEALGAIKRGLEYAELPIRFADHSDCVAALTRHLDRKADIVEE